MRAAEAEPGRAVLLQLPAQGGSGHRPSAGTPARYGNYCARGDAAPTRNKRGGPGFEILSL